MWHHRPPPCSRQQPARHITECVVAATLPLHIITTAPGSFLRRFFEDTAAMTPEQRAAYLEDPPADAPSLDDAHAVRLFHLLCSHQQPVQSAAAEGQTAAPSADDDVDLHFVALTAVDGQLYELDGRKREPIHHGDTSGETFLQDAVKVVQAFIETSGSTQFSLLALAPTV